MAESYGESFGANTATNLDREPQLRAKKLRITIAGAGGSIAAHEARRLRSEGHYIIACDWKKNEHMSEDMFCDEFHNVNLLALDNCLTVTKGVDYVVNFATGTGGMGFSQSNLPEIIHHNAVINSNLLEAARINGVTSFVSNVCISSGVEHLETDVSSVKESYAQPTLIQDANGPYGIWKGEREKAPLVLNIEALRDLVNLQMLGDGKQTCPFIVIDEHIEGVGVVRLMKLNFQPMHKNVLNEIVVLANEEMPIYHITGPEGVDGPNSNNVLIEEKLGWAPLRLWDGLATTHKWLKEQIVMLIKNVNVNINVNINLNH